MSGIEKIDKNIAVEKFNDDGGYEFHSVLEDPIKIYGMIPAFPLRRFPKETAERISPEVEALSYAAAGGRIRFVTNSKRLAVRAVMPYKSTFPQMTYVGSSCFDQYVRVGGRYVYNGLFISSPDRGEIFENDKFICADDGGSDVTINLPVYEGASEMYIGIDPGSYIKEAPGYRNEKPVVFYGSSITMGGCASRPGNTYENMILRRFDCDYINFGLAGRAMGDIPLAEYIASKPTSLFVYDYDFNAPDADYLKKTHEPFFLKIREKNPDIPVIMISRINWTDNAAGDEIMTARRRVIEETAENAEKRGDKKVYFINGFEFSNESMRRGVHPSDCTVDGIHPNDLGLSCMAKIIGDKIAEVTGW